MAKLHRLRILIFFLLLIFLLPLHGAEKDCLPEIPVRYTELAAQHGLKINLDSFYDGAKEKSVNQSEFEDFLEIFFKNMSLLNPAFIQMSRCHQIIFRKNMKDNGYFVSGKVQGVILKYPNAKSCNHEFFHAYDLLAFARRFWSSFNHPDFRYNGPGFYRPGLGESTYRQLWRASYSIAHFESDFMRSYGQVNTHEDAAVIFEYMIDPEKIGNVKSKMQKSRYLKQKVLLIAAQTSFGMGKDYWQKKLELSPEDIAEFNKIRDRLDVEKTYNIKIHYTPEQLRRYGAQLRTSSCLLDLPAGFVAASGLKEIRFWNKRGSLLKRDIITIRDDDPCSLIFWLFTLYCRKKNVLSHTDIPFLDTKEAAKLFWSAAFYPDKRAKLAFKDKTCQIKIQGLKKMTAPDLPPDFWREYDCLLQELTEEKIVDTHFSDSGIRFIRELPTGVSGTVIPENEQSGVEKIIKLCCCLFTQDFLKKAGYTKIVFARNMTYRGKKGSQFGIGDTLCLTPVFTADTFFGITFYK